MITLIDNALLDAVAADAQASPRGRKNRNFHADNDFPCHRLLNAIEPGSYVAPHRHLAADKDETLLIVRGRLGLVTFDEHGRPVDAVLLGSGTTRIGVDIPSGTWHTVFALERGTIFFEAKAGPYLPLTADERATWAPAEEGAEATAYLAGLLRLVGAGGG